MQYPYISIWNSKSLLLLIGFLPISLSAQTTLRAIVIDGNYGHPLPFVNVVSDDGTIGATTDMDGMIAVEVPELKRITFTFSFVGYLPIQIEVEDWHKAQKRHPKGLPTFRLSDPGNGMDPVIVVKPLLSSYQVSTPTSQLLTQADLKVADDINISTAFDGLPGIQIQQGALNTQRLSMRGIGARTPFASNQVRLYWNDIPLTDGNGESVLEDIEIGLLQAATAQTGPAPVQLGANLGGSIQLFSREWKALNWALSGGLSYGSFNRNRQWLNLHNRHGKWEQDVTLARSHSNGYRENNDYDRLSLTSLGRWRGKTSNTIYLLHLRQLQAEIPSSLSPANFLEDPVQAAFTWGAVNGREDQLSGVLGVQHMRVLTRFSTGNELVNRSSVFINRRTNDEVRPFNVLDEGSWQYGLRSVFETTFSNRAGLYGNYQLGFELAVEDYTQTTFETLDGGSAGPQLASGEEDRLQYFLFFQHIRPLFKDQLELHLGINYRQLQQGWAAQGQNNDFSYDGAWLPNLGVYYQLLQRVRLFARVNRGITTLDPSAVQQNRRLEAPIIRPSLGWNYEAGLQWKTPTAWKSELTFFQMDLTDELIAQETASGETFFVNAGASRYPGVEASFSIPLWRNEEQFLSLTNSLTLGNYTFQDFEKDGQQLSGNRIPGTVQTRYLGTLQYKDGDRWQTQLRFDYQGDQAVNDINSELADGRTLLHLQASWRPLRRHQRWQVFGGINNIFDTQYASMVQINARGFGGRAARTLYPGLPRWGFVGVRFE